MRKLPLYYTVCQLTGRETELPVHQVIETEGWLYKPFNKEAAKKKKDYKIRKKPFIKIRN